MFCLPKAQSAKFLAAVNSGELNPIKLGGMKSAARLEAISKILGEDTGKEVNALFESKLLMPNYMQGLVNWVKEVSGAWDPKVRESTVDKINNLDERILNPGNQESFLHSLAAEKLGFNIKPEQAKQIFDKAQEAKKLQEEWKKTLDQKVSRRDVNNPTTIIRNAYGRAVLDLQDLIETMKPSGQTFLDHALDVYAAPKTAETGLLHFSALGVQGWGMISRVQTWEAALEQFKYFANGDRYKDLMAYIISHPDYEFSRAAGLGLTDVTDQLNLREEAIQSSILQRMNTYAADKSGLPINVLGASSRAFTGFLNYTRFNVFVDLLNAARSTEEAAGRGLTKDSQIVRDIGSVINNFTGRGHLDETLLGLNPKTPDKLGHMQTFLNALFFAPRKLAATVQMFNPLEYSRLYYNGYKSGNFTAANAAVRQLTGSIMATGAVLYLANTMGFNVDFDPTSQDFLKIQLPGGIKLDITGGNAIWIRFLARMIMNKEITAHGKEIDLGEGYKPTTRAELLGQYVRGKLAPVSGVIADAMVGSDPVGRPFDVPEELRSHMEPILMSSMMNYYYENPHKAVTDIPVLSAMFGVNVESPFSVGTRHGLNAWGEPENHGYLGEHEEPRTPLDAALDKIGYVQRFPSNTINGVKLTDQQQKQYIQQFGTMAKARLTNLVESPSFANMPLIQQQRFVKMMVQNSKTNAQSYVTAHALGTSNDILRKSLKNAQDKLMGVDSSTTSESSESTPDSV